MNHLRHWSIRFDSNQNQSFLFFVFYSWDAWCASAIAMPFFATTVLRPVWELDLFCAFLSINKTRKISETDRYSNVFEFLGFSVDIDNIRELGETIWRAPMKSGQSLACSPPRSVGSRIKSYPGKMWPKKTIEVVVLCVRVESGRGGSKSATQKRPFPDFSSFQGEFSR